jgi:hypothetical protein
MGSISSTARALLILALAAGSLGCPRGSGSDEGDDPGRVKLGVRIPQGIVLNQLDYTMTGPFLRQTTGTITVPRPVPEVLATISGLPPGIAYSVVIEGVSVDGQARCQGDASFKVLPGRTTMVMIFLQCRTSGTSGEDLQITATVDVCPVITSFSVSPVMSTVGGAVAVSARATDVDDGPPTLHWSAASGRFDDPSAADTQYHCLAPGVVTVAIIAADRICQELATVDVSCVSIDVDNLGGADAGVDGHR